MNKENINHPKHYTTSKIECIEAMESQMSREQFTGYLKGCVIKYIWRYEKKNNRIEDLEKANWYLDRLIKFESGDDYKDEKVRILDLKQEEDIKKEMQLAFKKCNKKFTLENFKDVNKKVNEYLDIIGLNKKLKDEIKKN